MQGLRSGKSRSKVIFNMKSNFLSESIMNLLNMQGLNLAYGNADVTNDAIHHYQCDMCSGTCNGLCTTNCGGGCWG